MIKDFLQKRKKDIFFITLLLAFSVFALRQLLPKGIFYAHDISAHVVRTAHYINSLKQGQFPVRVSTELAYGRSYPIFNYSYFFQYLCAAFIHLIGFGLVDSIRLLIFLATIFSILVFYAFLRLRYSKMAAFLGSMLYLLVPFRFLTIFVTGQLGVVLAFSCTSLILYFLDHFLLNKNKKALVLLALSYSFLIGSHLISAIILTPAFMFYFLWMQKRFLLKDLVKYLFPALLILLLSASYLLPAFFEMDLIRAGNKETVHFADHYVSLKQLFYSPWGYWYSIVGFNDEISFQLGLAQWLIIFSASAYCLMTIKRQNSRKLIILILFILAVLFLMLPQSAFFWNSFSFLTVIQHPWRLLMIPMFLIPILSASVIDSLKNKILAKTCVLFLLVFALYSNRNYQRPMESTIRYDDQHYQSNTQVFYGSGDVGWEFLPKWAPDQPKTFPKDVIDQTLLSSSSAKPEKLSLDQTWDLTLNETKDISLNVFYFPNWQLELDGLKQSSWPNEEGLITTSIPAGEHQLRLYLTSTNLQKVANGLSLLGIVFSFILLLI